jgi:hypothetical protein
MMALRRIAVALEALAQRRRDDDPQYEKWSAKNWGVYNRIALALELQNTGVIRATCSMLEEWGEKDAAGVLWRAYRHQPGREWPHPADHPDFSRLSEAKAPIVSAPRAEAAAPIANIEPQGAVVALRVPTLKRLIAAAEHKALDHERASSIEGEGNRHHKDEATELRRIVVELRKSIR